MAPTQHLLTLRQVHAEQIEDGWSVKIAFDLPPGAPGTSEIAVTLQFQAKSLPATSADAWPPWVLETLRNRLGVPTAQEPAAN